MPARGDVPASILPGLPDGARLLLVRLRSLGDAVLTTPVLRALKLWRPDFRLSILMYEDFMPVLEGNPDLEEVIMIHNRTRPGPSAALRALAEIRRRKFSACFNLHGSTVSALLTLGSGAPHRVAAAPFRNRWAYTARAPHASVVLGRDDLHSVENRLAPFYWSGLPRGEIPSAQVFPQREARCSVQGKLASLGVEPGTAYAVLQPTANFHTKQWPLERYAELARFLETEHDMRPVFSCGPGESRFLDGVAGTYGKRLLRLDPLSLAELVALLEGASLFVGNDSGPAHIAAALRRPIVVLFGSSDSTAWRPWRAPHAVVQNFYECNPCRGDRCYAFDRPECILSISVEQVRQAIDRILATTSSPAQERRGSAV